MKIVSLKPQRRYLLIFFIILKFVTSSIFPGFDYCCALCNDLRNEYLNLFYFQILFLFLYFFFIPFYILRREFELNASLTSGRLILHGQQH